MNSKLLTLKSKTIKSKIIKHNFYIFLISILYLLLQIPAAVFADTGLSETSPSEIRKIAILPFEINSQKDISYIKNGIFQMLSSRLAWKDNTLVVTERDVHESLIKSDSINSTSSSSGSIGSPSTIKTDLLKIAENTKSDYIIRGSITEFAGAFSVDATVYNISQDTSQSFFAQAETPEKIIPGVEILSAKINKEIFNRETPSLKLIDEDKSTGSLNNIRANPEKLMPSAMPEQLEKKRPFWKFWGKDNSSSAQSGSSIQNSSNDKIEPEEKVLIHAEIDTDDEEPEADKKPFWKFW